ncbi:MAG TPA: type VI secretion system protein TssR domain-containing protein [Cryomorphaceae bacterium]|nr:type VI secretion system protein TssR domain-containing protein [Cryomorphaceae bacterium]
MKNLRIILPLFLGLIFLISGSAFSQKKMKIMGVPKSLERPIDVFDDPAMVNKMVNDTRDQDREIRWVVFSDRDENPVYAEPDNSSKPASYINMGEFFYVLDEKTDWIQIGKSEGFPDKLKTVIKEESIGWVPKSRMLLWSHGLISKRTGINKKAFLLNRGDDTEILENLNRDGDKQVFRDPAREKAADNVKIYSFFFVFKKEGDMYLLSKEEYLTPSKDSQNTLIGWIHRRDLQEWNTRLSLEPNFSEEAYKERKGNPKLRARSYFDVKGLKGVSANSFGDMNYLFKDDDPAYLKPAEVSEEDPRRLKGGVLRYPIFGATLTSDDVTYYRSGAIGNIKVVSDQDGKVSFESEIPENAMAQMSSFADKYIERSKKVNVFFVIEGTDKTEAFKPTIVSAINSLQANPLLGEKSDKIVQYGALIYRAPLEGERVVEVERLGPNLADVTQFVESQSFTNINNRSDETAVFYGIQQAVLKAGFNPQELNIMVVLGGAGDFSRNSGMKTKAKKESWDEYVEPNELRTLFAELQNLKMNLHCIQLVNNDLQTYQDFANDIKGTIVNVAKERYNKAQSDTRFQRYMEKNDQLSTGWKVPIFELSSSNKYSAMEGSIPGVILKPVGPGRLKADELKEGLNFVLDQTLINENAVVELFQIITKEGEELDIERFSEENGLEFSSVTPGFALKMAEMHAELDISEDDLQNLMGKKLNLYTEVYLPVKPEGAENNTFSQVLFMPFADLRAYRMDIDRSIEKALNAASEEERREELYNMLVSRTEKLAGEASAKNRDDFSVGDLHRMEQGVYNEGGDRNVIQLETTAGDKIRLGDINNNKGNVTSEDVDALINGFDRIRKTLKDIERDELYPFQLKTNRNNTYYWIRMDQFFPVIKGGESN